MVQELEFRSAYQDIDRLARKLDRPGYSVFVGAGFEGLADASAGGNYTRVAICASVPSPAVSSPAHSRLLDAERFYGPDPYRDLTGTLGPKPWF